MKPRHKNSSGLLTASVAQMEKEMEAECPPDKLTPVKRNWGKALGTAAPPGRTGDISPAAELGAKGQRPVPTAYADHIPVP